MTPGLEPGQDVKTRPQAGFTRATQNMHTAVRILAYSLATLFMIVMVVRGVWLTQEQMEADSERSIAVATTTITALIKAGDLNLKQAQAVLEPIAPIGVVFSVDDQPPALDTAAMPKEHDKEVRRIPLANGQWTLVAVIDHTKIRKAALRANLPYILLVLALGLPVIMIFLYIGWAVNRPALQLLFYAQAGLDEDLQPPKLPTIWSSVLARLQQLRDSQTQMQAFLDHAPIGMMFRDKSGALTLVNRYGASFYGKSPEELATKPVSFFNSYFRDNANLAGPLFLDPLNKAESTTVETEFHGPSGEEMSLLIKSFPVLDRAGKVSLIGNFFIDVTEQRKAEAQLSNSRAQLIAFFDNLPTSIYLKQVDHRVVYVSKHLAEQYGKRPEDMNGKFEYDLHIDAMKPHLIAMDEHIMSTGEAVLMEGEHLQFNRMELVSRFPVFNDMGEITHIGGMNFDIDARAKAQAELEETKALFEAFIQHAPNSMVLMDPQGRYTMINDAAASYYGKTPEVLLAEGVKTMNAPFPEAQSVIVPLFARVLATRKFEQVDTTFVMPSGEIRELAFAFFPILRADGEVAFIGNITYDLTDGRRAQAELIKTQALFEAFIQNAPYPMALMDAVGQHIMVNHTAAEYYGQPADILLQKDSRYIVSRWPEFKTVIAPMMAEVLTKQSTQQADTLFEMPSGDMRNMASSLFPILGPDHKLAFIGMISHDMTEERRARAELIESRDALHQSEKLAALGSMLAGVSHELNNPLAAVIGQTALLGEDLEGTEHAARISKIRRAADRCARIVQSFLAMARQKAPEYRSIDINDQVRAAVELTEYQMRAANVSLELRLQHELPKINADPDQLHQVIVNLLTNARQAVEEKEGERSIVLTTSIQKRAIVLSVADNGKGIDAATRDRIFDPFFTTKAVGSGTGIGLSYSLGIVEAHGGTISIGDAEDETGTIFVISLPAKDQIETVSAPSAHEPADAKGKVLVIDDEEDVAETLADMLERMGLDVSVAIGGVAGQAAMASGEAFDFILSDIRMPDCDGPALFDWIAANRPDLATRLAFVTGDTLSGIAADFLEKAQCPVLEKPFTPAGLRALVAVMLEP